MLNRRSFFATLSAAFASLAAFGMVRRGGTALSAPFKVRVTAIKKPFIIEVFDAIGHLITTHKATGVAHYGDRVSVFTADGGEFSVFHPCSVRLPPEIISRARPTAGYLRPSDDSREDYAEFKASGALHYSDSRAAACTLTSGFISRNGS